MYQYSAAALTLSQRKSPNPRIFAQISNCNQMSARPISTFIEKNFLHFNAAALVDAAKGYKKHISEGKKMMVTLAGAMSTGELGISFAEMIRQNKVQII